MAEAQVVIGLREVYDATLGLRADVQRVEGKLDHGIEVDRDHENRLRALEGAEFVTRDEMAQRSSRTLILAGTIAGVVSALAAVIALIVATSH